MTNRQKMLGVTEYGYYKGIKLGEFLGDIEAFTAKAAMIRKGQYHGVDVMRMWFPEYAAMDNFCYAKLQQAQPMFFGLTAIMHEHFNYTDTNGLDLLTVK